MLTIAGHFVDAVQNNSRLIQSREKMAGFFHPISTFDVGWQPEILSPIARLPAGLYYRLSPQNMEASEDWFSGADPGGIESIS